MEMAVLVFHRPSRVHLIVMEAVVVAAQRMVLVVLVQHLMVVALAGPVQMLEAQVLQTVGAVVVVQDKTLTAALVAPV
jgi:hypothetical protein